MLLATLTHARLRASQGDIRGARRILRGLLARDPQHRDARRLLAELENARDTPIRDVTPPAPPPVESRTATQLGERFVRKLNPDTADPRVARLRRWLERLGREW